MPKHEAFDLERLHAALNSRTIGHSIDYHATVASTMSLARRLAEKGRVRSGHVVLAEEQSAGKGRRGRNWTAPYGRALLASVLLEPPMIPAFPALLPMAAGLAVVEAINDVAPPVGNALHLKWPNDVLLGKGRFAGKVAGILVESAFECGTPAYVILGVGINVNQTDAELPVVEAHMPKPTSIQSVLGERIDRTELLIALCLQMERFLDPQMQPDAILDRWRSRLGMLGKSVAVYAQPDANVPDFIGIALDITPTGQLLVRDANGETHSLAAADVSVRDADL